MTLSCSFKVAETTYQVHENTTDWHTRSIDDARAMMGTEPHAEAKLITSLTDTLPQEI